MQLRYVLPAWLLLTAVACPPSAAQTAPAEPEPEEIVVKGVKARDREINQFVGALTKAPIGGQISRFDWAVCPAAVGLSTSQNDAIVQRLRRVAEAVGAPVGKSDCRPNTLLIIAHDPKDFIEQLREKHPAYFTDPLGNQIRLPQSEGRATAWHVEGRLTDDGIPATVARNQNGGRHYSVSTTASSRLQPATRPHFVGGVMVVDLAALTGLSTVQVADYAAMRLLARTDPQRLAKSAAPTILNILDAPIGTAVPLTMTDWDFGFLKALYTSREHRLAHQQRGEMRRLLREDLQKPEAE